MISYGHKIRVQAAKNLKKKTKKKKFFDYNDTPAWVKKIKKKKKKK